MNYGKNTTPMREDGLPIQVHPSEVQTDEFPDSNAMRRMHWVKGTGPFGVYTDENGVLACNAVFAAKAGYPLQCTLPYKHEGKHNAEDVPGGEEV